jgi:hypothetical protein
MAKARTPAPVPLEGKSDWLALSPPFQDGRKSRRAFRDFAASLALLAETMAGDELLVAVDDAVVAFDRLADQLRVEDQGSARAASLVVADLCRQGWRLRVDKEGAWAAPPVPTAIAPAAEKDRIRKQELIKRNEQLGEPAAREFVRSMERKHLHEGKHVSVLQLLRDGRELARSLRAALARPEEERAEALGAVIDPYLEFVAEDARCSTTGLRLQDIWRYFRHTWVNQYVSVPGRSMMILVRDRAAPFHPVIGIAALSSPIVQIRERDLWVGWHPTGFVEQARAHPTDEIARWIPTVVDAALDEVYVRDFLADGTLSRASLRSPTRELIKQLQELGREERLKHHRFVQSQDHKKRFASEDEDGKTGWEAKAETHLFRSKRALLLAELFWERMVLEQHLGPKPDRTQLAALLADPEGARAAGRIVRKAKGDRVGILMADISVCGAVQPYNAILGGKLVAMLTASPEVVDAYRRRYARAESEIASSMAGRPVIRAPQLVLLGTTSLYGVGSSQYNRISVPCDLLGGQSGDFIKYLECGRSEAFGTSHFSEATIDALSTLVSQSDDGTRVNSIFGEGVSPKLRKIRDGLELLHFPPDRLLRHGRHRVVYVIPLIRNLRNFLLGIDASPDYLVPLDRPTDATRGIGTWWRERWLRNRAASDAVLAEVERHTLVYPIRHGARVVLPLTGGQRDLPFPGEG